jgi:hypothetical protein
VVSREVFQQLVTTSRLLEMMKYSLGLHGNSLLPSCMFLYGRDSAPPIQMKTHMSQTSG